MIEMPTFNRVLLKVTGEYFSGKENNPLDHGNISTLAEFIKNINQELVIVVGAGNIFRGRTGVEGSDRVTNDQIGMLATVVNAKSLGAELDRIKVQCRVMTAFDVEGVTEKYVVNKAISYLEEKKIVIVGGGTGHAYCTTDYAAVLRALELKCDVILKGSSVDKVCSGDPKKDPNVIQYDELDIKKAINDELGVMDLTAFTLAYENKMPIIVFNINKLDNITKILAGEPIGTRIR